MKFSILILVLAVSQISWAQAPAGVQIQYVNAKGKGCQNGQIGVTIAPDGRSFSVLMDNYLAEASVKANLDLKNCAIEVGILAPAGWSYSLLTADYRGFVSAEAGTQVSHQVLYSFDGSRPINENPGFQDSIGRYSFKQQVFNGPIDDTYYIRNQIDSRTALWSPCSIGIARPLVIQTYLMARSMVKGKVAQISLDSVDGAIEQQFQWTWKRCGAVAPVPVPPGHRPPRYGGR